ncbi:MAG: hypothetical protein JST59_09310 [Actinobacteria bacterium]|nr:hypothetical protein [Actinomycetota bacterium]
MLRRLLPLLIAVAALVAFAPSAGAHCIKRHQVPIAKGTSPTGWHWSVDGSIGNNGGHCREWLFGMDFNLEGAIGWSWGTGIPAGGELGRHTEIDALDNLLLDGSDRVFSGSVEGEAVKLVATLSNNKRLVIHPKLPAAKLRRKVGWLRGVRYFVAYYKPEGFVTGIMTFNRAGTLLYRDKNFEDSY